VKAVFGEDFQESANVLRLPSLLAPLILGGNVLGHMMVVLGRQGLPYVLVRSGSLVSLVVLASWLIPQVGVYGSAVALVASEGVGFVALWVLVSRGLRVPVVASHRSGDGPSRAATGGAHAPSEATP
jgi:O-antigen/teichoic acid export membrane protein